jgi:hypothetical protein
VEICLKYLLDKNPQKQPFWKVDLDLRISKLSGRVFFVTLKPGTSSFLTSILFYTSLVQHNKIVNLQLTLQPIRLQLCSWDCRAVFWLVETLVEGCDFFLRAFGLTGVHANCAWKRSSWLTSRKAQSAWDIPYLNRKIFLFRYQIFKSDFFRH